ncbi:ABC transporter ATP-binding protein/permease [Patescibacteria group bacterium]|nr:ABC transporter ATP-binding protein/permease [Patescibacteria group bacterium]MCG2702254.1 ABC transporter ATP-binding protein/permease [Candidatus Parcubacteria bacterium]MBU4210036.1 ABC transporter ATP-binding protein/permease [Patescibacteria group bacterium]MBU4264732.1 ABC transporter ATP-binding protein/permease [Patescibacteria group bacterium]MBU4390070.1 ABC transporter ATP-binding protein/permease [Patescibacteria group bacterium]
MFKVYKNYYRFIFRYKKQFFLFLFALIGLSITESIQPYFLKLFTDNISSQNFEILFKTLILFVFIRLLSLLFDNLTYWLGDKFLSLAVRDARLTVFKKIQDLDFAFHLSKSTGSLISAIKRGDNAFWSFHHSINIRLTRIAIKFFVVLFFFFNINWQISIFLILSFIGNIFLARLLIRHNIKTRREFNKEEDRLSHAIVDNLINFETVKLFAKETWELKRLKNLYITWMKKFWNFANSFRVIGVTVGILGNLMLFLTLLVALKQLTNSIISPGEYLMIFGFITVFYENFFELVYQFRNIAKDQTDLKKYFSVLDKDTLVKDPVNPVKKISATGEIEFKNLSFTYPETTKKAVKNINLKIRQGQSIAFVGRSGVGKTTLIKLLMRFYDPDKGEILLDNINIKKFSKNQLRSFIGVVPQEPIMFNNSIAYNIAYGRDKTTQKEVVSAAKMANLHNFISTLPKKYKTRVGERGVKLSGGQKQRLAIARMILSNPDIVIFDEATSQLDSVLEKQIQDAFWKATKNKTTLIIAHRLSTVIKAEKIVVMKHGKIKEIGSHYQLLKNPDSLYSRFWQLQSRKD